MMMTLYLTGKDKAALADAVTEANALLGPTGLRFVDPKQDLVPLDSFLRALPFNFEPEFDQRYLVRSRLTFASHIAALLPVYGRSHGTQHPGMWFWNRGGEPLWMDPLNLKDRKKNAHMLTFGPTGAGKSATLVYQCMLTMAVHRPRMIIVDAGNSFGLMVADMAAKGLSTRECETYNKPRHTTSDDVRRSSATQAAMPCTQPKWSDHKRASPVCAKAILCFGFPKKLPK